MEEWREERREGGTVRWREGRRNGARGWGKLRNKIPPLTCSDIDHKPRIVLSHSTPDCDDALELLRAPTVGVVVWERERANGGKGFDLRLRFLFAS